MTTVGIVVGNPKPESRTLTVARAVGRAAAAVSGLGDAEVVEVDLATLATQLFDWSAPDVRAAVDRIADTTLLVVASPTYKATYTGLLKAFLDCYSVTGLSGVTAVPVMVGAGPGHALAVEVHLRPVLVEIGASVPTRGLYVTEARLDELPSLIDDWLIVAAPLLHAATRRAAPLDPGTGYGVFG